jgi:hypothetical protein
MPAPQGTRLFHTAPFLSAELLVLMLEKNGIAGTWRYVDDSLPPDDDPNRETHVFVPAVDYDHAHELFYGDRPGEL